MLLGGALQGGGFVAEWGVMTSILERFKTWYFYFTIFIAGAAVLVIEIGGTRLLAPFYGSTVYVWSSLISVTMISLALGYTVGGKLADIRPTIHAIWLILLAAGLTIYAIPAYDQLILPFTDSFGIRWGPFIASLFLFAAPLFFLGMISPFAVRLRARALDHLGATAGNLYALATLGSLAGALMSGFYLAPNFPFTIIFRFLGLILISLFILWRLLNLKSKNL